MTLSGWALIALYLILILALAKPAGLVMHRLYAPAPLPLERGLLSACGIDSAREQGWIGYAVALMTFNMGGVILLFAILKLQGLLPLNPQHLSGIDSWLAFNTAVSFVTNTNWQNYGGETTLSYFSQMAGLTVHNFLSAATGIAVAFAFIRGFARSGVATVGNFWADVTRITLYLLLPASLVFALFYVATGVPQTLASYVTATTLEGAKQTIALGPVASQLAIKMLGTNGGGFFNANSAHPFENPIGAMQLRADAVDLRARRRADIELRQGGRQLLGRAGRSSRRCWCCSLPGVAVVYWAEAAGNPVLHSLGVAGRQHGGQGSALRHRRHRAVRGGHHGGVLRRGQSRMHDSFTPLGGLIPLFNIQLGEIVIGGVGAGFYGFLLFAILAVFVAGLMVGRTPEYVGKKIEAREVKLAVLAIAVLPLFILGLTGAGQRTACRAGRAAQQGAAWLLGDPLRLFERGREQRLAPSPGLSGNTPFYNGMLAFAMLFGRFFVIMPVLAIAGSLARQEAHCLKRRDRSRPPARCGWACWSAVILIVGGLTFLPSLALGPIADQSRDRRRHRFSEEVHEHGKMQTSLFTGPACRARDRATRSCKLDPRSWSAIR